MSVTGKLISATEELYVIDFGTQPAQAQVQYKLKLLKPAIDESLKTGCWCTSAKVGNNEVSIAVYIKGGSGTDHSRTLKEGTYKDGGKYKIVLNHKVA